MTTSGPPTTTPPRPPSRPPPVAAKAPAPPPAAPRTTRTLVTSPPRTTAGHRVVMFGTGGIGKTTTACRAPGPIAFFDLDESLGILRTKLDALGLNEHEVVEGVATWKDLRETLAAPGWERFKTIVIDSATKAEELAAAHVIKTIAAGDRDKRPAENIEDYGWGKGFQHLYDVFGMLLGDLDAHARAGRNVVLVCHECSATVPNPAGNDWIRYEPRLYTSNGGKASIRLRVKEWADHVLFFGYDVDANREGKGKGKGTATMHPRELPHCMAKSRTLVEPMSLDECDAELWARLLV